jgi:dTMP kinase
MTDPRCSSFEGHALRILNRPHPGLFITFEGPDGVGKSTQLRALKDRIAATGRDVVFTREPGGSVGAEEIRRLILGGDIGRWSATTELLLFNAARRDHVERTVLPALGRGSIVLCDRFVDTTRAYQAVRNPDLVQTIEDLHRTVIGIEADLTLMLLPGPAGIAAARDRALAREAGASQDESRFERMGSDFQISVDAAFRKIARAHPERCIAIDADGEIPEVSARIDAALAPLLDLSARPDLPDEDIVFGGAVGG